MLTLQLRTSLWDVQAELTRVPGYIPISELASGVFRNVKRAGADQARIQKCGPGGRVPKALEWRRRRRRRRWGLGRGYPPPQ